MAISNWLVRYPDSLMVRLPRKARLAPCEAPPRNCHSYRNAYFRRAWRTSLRGMGRTGRASLRIRMARFVDFQMTAAAPYEGFAEVLPSDPMVTLDHRRAGELSGAALCLENSSYPPARSCGASCPDKQRHRIHACPRLSTAGAWLRRACAASTPSSFRSHGEIRPFSRATAAAGADSGRGGRGAAK